MITRDARDDDVHEQRHSSHIRTDPLGGTPLLHLARLRLVVTRNPGTTATWLSAFTLLSLGTLFDDAHVARWGLGLGGVAIVLTCRSLAHSVTASITHVIELFEDDVVLDDDDPPDCGTIDLARARARRRRPRRLGRFARLCAARALRQRRLS